MSCEIWLGDSREANDLPMGINCIIADPPYGVEFRSRRAITPNGKRFEKDIEGDGNLRDAMHLAHQVFNVLAPKTADNCEVYVFTRWDIVGNWIAWAHTALRPLGFNYKMLLIWDKGIPGMGDIDANWGCGHELILYLKKGRRDVNYRRSAIIAVDKVDNYHHIHPTEKPVGLIEVLIGMSTDSGDLVVDPFAGSGSSIVAAQNLGRRGIGIELDEHYVDAARGRLAQGTLPI